MSRPEQPDADRPPPGRPEGAAAQGTNVLAILSLVSAFVFAPAAIVLGHLAKRQIRQTGADGRALADWGLFLGYLGTVVGALCCGGLLVVTIRQVGVDMP